MKKQFSRARGVTCLSSLNLVEIKKIHEISVDFGNWNTETDIGTQGNI